MSRVLRFAAVFAFQHCMLLLDLQENTILNNAVCPVAKALLAGYEEAYDGTQRAGRSCPLKEWLEKQTLPDSILLQMPLETLRRSQAALGL